MTGASPKRPAIFNWTLRQANKRHCQVPICRQVGGVGRLRSPPDADTIYPVCVDGQLACPPEDCGGISGYYDLLKVLAKPSHRRYKEIREWLGRDFHPEEFAREEANRFLAPRKPRKKSSIQ